MKRNQEQNCLRYKGDSRLAALFVASLFVLHPLILHNGYFDITETKQIVFSVISAVFLLLCMFRYALSPVKRLILSREVCSVFLWFGLYFLACALSGSLSSAWIAEDNRYQGLLSMGLYAAVFAVLSRSRISGWAIWCVLAAFSVVMVLAIINHWGLDPLKVMTYLIPFDQGRYTSTIGNINFFGSYVCLLLPVIWMLWCSATEGTSRAALMLCILVGTFGAAAAKSEGTVLGLGVAYVLLPLLCKNNPGILRRWPILAVLTILYLQAFSLLTNWVGGDGFSQLISLVLRPGVSLVLTAMGAAVFFYLKDKDTKWILRFRKWYLFSVLIAFFLFLLVLSLVNLLFADAELGIVSRYMVIDAEWGTDRGKVWFACLQRWGQMPLWQKLLGGGSGCVARLDALNPVFHDAILDAAHCEFLHYLLTHGILGLALYGVLNGLLICRTIKQGTPMAAALCLGVIGYLAQSGVNIAQPMTTPLFFVLLAVLAGELHATKEGHTLQKVRVLTRKCC